MTRPATYPAIRLETDLLPTGPWIFGRQVAPDPNIEDGSLVEVLDHRGRFVGHALYNGASDIRLRMLSKGRRTDLARPREFFARRLSAAARLRRKVLRLPAVTDAWRLAHAEGDDLPGLIVDHLGPVTVCEYHSLGFYRLREMIEQVLVELDPQTRVVHRVPKSAARAEGFEGDEAEGVVPEDLGPVQITEHGLSFPVHPGRGHKTGWFCDQRDNRQKLAALASGRDVLDLCTNGGGFALHAARAGARRVRAVDLDEKVLALASEAGRAAGLEVDWIHEDLFDTLRRVRRDSRCPDLIVLDPHKLIPGRKQMDEGRRRYLDMNSLALQALAPGGLCMTFSCSGALDLPGFLGILFQAARRADRGVRLLEVLSEAPDHPQRPEFPRSRYLKGALLALD
ncbi:MAG: class I SAM-dependent rRNA methyltransferase [Planctomycetota bacterium]